MTTKLFKTGGGVQSFVPGHSFTINSLCKHVVGALVLFLPLRVPVLSYIYFKYYN